MPKRVATKRRRAKPHHLANLALALEAKRRRREALASGELSLAPSLDGPPAARPPSERKAPRGRKEEEEREEGRLTKQIKYRRKKVMQYEKEICNAYAPLFRQMSRVMQIAQASRRDHGEYRMTSTLARLRARLDKFNNQNDAATRQIHADHCITAFIDFMADLEGTTVLVRRAEEEEEEEEECPEEEEVSAREDEYDDLVDQPGNSDDVAPFTLKNEMPDESALGSAFFMGGGEGGSGLIKMEIKEEEPIEPPLMDTIVIGGDWRTTPCLPESREESGKKGKRRTAAVASPHSARSSPLASARARARAKCEWSARAEEGEEEEQEETGSTGTAQRCDECECAMEAEALPEHMLAAHGIEGWLPEYTGAAPRLCGSNHCDFTSEGMDAHREHMKTCHPSGQWSGELADRFRLPPDSACPFCPAAVAGVGALRTHLARWHSKMMCRVLGCSGCGRHYNRLYKLIYHWNSSLRCDGRLVLSSEYRG